MSDAPPPDATPSDNSAADDSSVSFSPPTPETLERLLPGYSVSALIAQGGMGAVYRSVQQRLDRPVAIKVLPCHIGVDLDFAARFEAEAKAMARLSHNNIVGVFDYGETSDKALLYIIMEFVDGTDLLHAIHKGTVTTTRQKIDLMIQVCDALQCAHNHGIVHRDIKPANILIDHSGTVKVADFGLAIFGHAAASEEQFGLGTPDYAAPEIFYQGEVADHRADLFSLGVVIHELMTGSLPSEDGAPPSATVGVDRRFDAVVARATASKIANRYPNATELKRDLIAIRDHPLPVPDLSRKTVSKVPRNPRAHSAKPATPAFSPATTPRQPRAAVTGRPPQNSHPAPKTRQAKSSPAAFVWPLLIIAAIAVGAWFLLFRPGDHPQPGGQIAPEPPLAQAPGPEPPPPTPVIEEPDAESPPDPDTPRRRIRVEGSLQDGQAIQESSATPHDDFARVGAVKDGWYGLRANGDLISFSANGSTTMGGVQSFVANSLWIAIVKQDGTIWAGNNRPVLPYKVNDAVKYVAGSNDHGILRGDGSTAFWGASYGSDTHLSEPPLPLSGIVDIAASISVMAVVDADGQVHCWGSDLTVNSRTLGDGVVALQAGLFNFVALTRSGEVFQWIGADIESASPVEIVPAGKIVAIRANGDTAAAQREDGSWFAWGANTSGVIEKINQLGAVDDLAFFTQLDHPEAGFVVWIEP